MNLLPKLITKSDAMVKVTKINLVDQALYFTISGINFNFLRINQNAQEHTLKKTY
jgi:hypothetical protein